MHSSTYVEEIDLKTHRFCTDCLRVSLATGSGRAPSPRDDQWPPASVSYARDLLDTMDS